MVLNLLTESPPVQFGVGAFLFLYLACLSFRCCLTMQPLWEDVQSAYLNRPSGYYSHSSVK